MKRLIPLFVFILCFGSCKDNEGPEVCGSENPTKDLIWLKNLISEIESNSLSEFTYIVQSRYERKTVFLIQSCCPFCSYAIQVYDCQGNDLGFLNNQNGVNSEKLKGNRVIWKPANSECVFTQS